METPPIWSLGLYAALVLLAAVGMLVVSHFLGERHRGRARGEPYESGVVPADEAPRRISPSYYTIALLFVIFDIEAVFLFAWAVAARQLGWTGFFEASIFVAVLLVALLFVIRQRLFELASPPGGPRAGQSVRRGTGS